MLCPVQKNWLVSNYNSKKKNHEVNLYSNMRGTYTIKLEMRNHIQFMLGHRTCGFCFSGFFFPFSILFKAEHSNVHSQTFPQSSSATRSFSSLKEF